MAYNSDFDKYVRGKTSSDANGNTSKPRVVIDAPTKTGKSSVPAVKNFDVVKMRESARREIRLEKGKVILRNTFLALAATGSVLGLAVTGCGLAIGIPAALRTVAALGSTAYGMFDILSFGVQAGLGGLVSGAGFKLCKKSLPYTLANWEKTKPYYDVVKEVHDETSPEKRGKK